MVTLNKKENALISFYNPGGHDELVHRINLHLVGQDIKTLTPDDENVLEQAALNSTLIFFPLTSEDDKNIRLCKKLQKNKLIVADIIAIDCFSDNNAEIKRFDIVGMGFDECIPLSQVENPSFKNYLLTKIKKGDDRLRRIIREEEYRRFSDALSSAPISVIVLDNERRAVFVSQHYVRAYPKLAPQLKRGVSIYDIFEMLCTEENVNRDGDIYRRSKEFLHQLNGSVEITIKDGKSFRLRAVPLPNARGSIITGQNISDYVLQKDILEKRTVQLKESLEKERSAREIQQQFIDMISHEFRTPLAIIDGNAEIIKKKGLNASEEEINERCQTIQGGVSRLTQMMDGILSSNMLRTGKIEVHNEVVNLGALISRLAHDHLSYNDDLSIKYDTTSLPEEVLLDQKFTMVILCNLLANAIKYNNNRPELFIKAITDDAMIIITVEDNGIGINTSELEKIFERYYRSQRTANKPGTGLGLSLARDLARLQGGDIMAENKEDQKGARFTVRFPLILPSRK